MANRQQQLQQWLAANRIGSSRIVMTQVLCPCCFAICYSCRFSGKSSSIGGSDSSSSAEEERRWRQWVDERFVKVMTANIYRTWE